MRRLSHRIRRQYLNIGLEWFTVGMIAALAAIELMVLVILKYHTGV